MKVEDSRRIAALVEALLKTMTPAELSAETGVSIATIYRWRRPTNKHKPNAVLFAKFEELAKRKRL